MTKKLKPSPEMKRSLDEFVEQRDSLKFKEHADLSRSAKTARQALAAKEKETADLAARIAKYEHPSLHSVIALLDIRPTLTRKQIAKELKVDLSVADTVLSEMEARGYNVHDGILSKQASSARPEVEHFYGDRVRFGVVSDTHIGNNHAMEHELGEAFAVFKREGITNVYAAGNLLDGEKTYRGQEYEINVMGADNVVANLARVWPKIPGITTYHIASSSCHEGFYLKSAGLLIGKLIERERPDMVYLGLDEADVVLHNSAARPRLRVIHPSGGSSYAESYRPQKIVESYAGSDKPVCLLVGHYHKMGVYDIRDVLTLQAGCLERQTPFMRKLSLAARLGFWIVDLQFSPNGSLRRAKTEWFKYYLNEGKVLKDWVTT